MGRSRRTVRHAEGFSLLEVIGVLTVLAILAGLLIPTVLGAIHSAAISQTASSIHSVKTACVGHCAQFSSIATDGSVNPPATISLDGSDLRALQFDKVLLWETHLESLFSPKLGDGILGPTNTRIQIVGGLPSSAQPTEDNSAYNLDGNGLNEASGMVVIEAVITGVPLEDAKALNDIIDGASLGQDSSGNDLRGRVKYANPASASSNGNSNGTGTGNTGNRNGNGNGQGNGNGNGGSNNGRGNGGTDNGDGNGGNGGNGNGNGGNGNGNGTGTGNAGNGSSGATQSASTVTVHVYLTHR